MVFSDLFFIYFFLPIFLAFYFLCGNITYRNVVLVFFSFVFYAWDSPVRLLLLLGSIGFSYCCSLMIDKYGEGKGGKIAVFCCVAANLGLLVAFKYTGFIAENINHLFKLGLPVPQIELPLGISFYTFQIISYIMDCYWGKVRVQRDFLKFSMYVSMFPSLVAGPIVRYEAIEKAADDRTVSFEDISEGVTRFAAGLAKKVIIADNLSPVAENFLGGSLTGLSVTGSWYAAALYALQVYFDFSGYSDMAVGLGRIMGFKLNENFNYPFICKNITEFWQRWHISLGSFFRDYLLYVPVFGRRRGLFNLFLVWFCTGLWHGASWNFVIWGLYFGVFIFIERMLGKRINKIPKIILHLYGKTVIVAGFGIFYFRDAGRLLQFLGNLIGANGNKFADRLTYVSFMNNIFLILAAVLFTFPIVPFVKEKLRNIKFACYGQVAVNLFLIATSSILLINDTDNPFLYFNF